MFIPLVPLKNHQTWLPHLRSAPLQVAPWRRTFTKVHTHPKQVRPKSWQILARGYKTVPDLEKNRIWSIFESSSQGCFGGFNEILVKLPYFTQLRNSWHSNFPKTKNHANFTSNRFGVQNFFHSGWSKRIKKVLPFHAQVASPGSLSDSIPDERDEMLELLHHWKIHRLCILYVCSAYVLLKKVIWMYKNCHQCVCANSVS